MTTQDRTATDDPRANIAKRRIRHIEPNAEQRRQAEEIASVIQSIPQPQRREVMIQMACETKKAGHPFPFTERADAIRKAADIVGRDPTAGTKCMAETSTRQAGNPPTG